VPVYHGWKRDLPDVLDFRYFPPVLQLPSVVDMRKYCSPVENQQDLGSCTANAIVGALELLEIKHKRPYVDYSRLFLYYNERVIDHTVSYDAGSSLRTGCKALNRNGICPEVDWPYNIVKFKKKPSAICYADATPLRTKISYHSIADLNSILQALNQGLPVVFGFVVYQSFEDIGSDGIMLMPNVIKEARLGGHAVVVVGFDRKKLMLIVRNSWGSSWGAKGYFYMPFEFVNPQFCADVWAIDLVA
jgi:C1A family cysteine protease